MSDYLKQKKKQSFSKKCHLLLAGSKPSLSLSLPRPWQLHTSACAWHTLSVGQWCLQSITEPQHTCFPVKKPTAGLRTKDS